MERNLPRRRPRSNFESQGEEDVARLATRTPSETSTVFKRPRLRGGGGSSDDDSDGDDQGSDNDDNDESDAEEDDIEEGTAHGLTRARYNGLSKAASRSAVPSFSGPSSRDFQPGAIVAVRVKDFVTYKYAEFFPGPNLNMVIGPNGTGKSSLVCAICLGLGYSYSVLGRATNYSDYVKRGESQAFVEIELKGRPKDVGNYKVELCIDGADSKRTFSLDGKRTGVQVIQTLMRKLRIQVDNLCQFLPQEKVAEFAGLGPIDLLDRTMQAIAPVKTMEQQKVLKELYDVQRESHRQVEDGAEHLRNLEARQQALQADVDKLKEREEVQQTISFYEDGITILAYAEARNTHHQAKAEKKETEKELERLKRSSAPALACVNRKQEYIELIQQTISARERALRASESACEAKLQDIEAADTKLKTLITHDEAEQKHQVTFKQELRGHVQKLATLRSQHNKGSNGFNAAEWNIKIRELDHEMRENRSKHGELEDELRSTRPLGEEKQRQKASLKREIDEMDSQAGQLLAQLKKLKPDVAAGWSWLKDNQDKFAKTVYGPAMLSCSVKDKRYSDLVQATLRYEDFLCFTAQTREDHVKLSDQFYKTMGLSVTIRTCQASFDTFRSPLPKEEVAELGFDGFGIEYIDGPEPVLAMLCSESRLHSTLVGLRPLTDEHFAKISAKDSIGQFVAGGQSYRTTRRREYGAAGISTSVSQVNKGRFWSDQPLDISEKQELQRRYEALNMEMKELSDAFVGKQTERRGLVEAWKELQAKSEEVKKQKSELQNEHSTFISLPDKIDAVVKQREQKLESINRSKALQRDIANQKDEAAVEHLKAVLSHTKSLVAVREASQRVLEARLRLVEAESDLQYLKDNNVDITRKLEEATVKVEELSSQLKEYKDAASELLEKAREIPQETSERVRREFGEDKTAADLEMDIAAEKAKLELIQAGNPHALQEYEKRASEIGKLRSRKENLDAQLAEVQAQIDELRAEWEPQVDELVSRINDAFAHNFEQINCAGEVSILKEEDFDKWAIDIKVRFRENETMQRLDKQRQSGGERAVSTVFYLMSLQAMAKAPFRVVDEINQGMDPRNERMVHERMVDIACNEHTSQYFLITPKLLRNLRYDPRMKVHCICSGEHMPEHDNESTAKMDMAKFVGIQRQLVAAV